MSTDPGAPDGGRSAEDALRDLERRLREKELTLKEKELDAKIAESARQNWLASPLLLAAGTTIFGLLGTGVGAALQGFSNTALERQKFEAGLIQKALETTDKNEAAKNLQFLVGVGLISQFDTQKIAMMARDPQTLPAIYSLSASSADAATTNRPISVADTKSVLQHLGLYEGPIDDRWDATAQAGLARFQKEKGLAPDGTPGARTAAALRDAWPEHFSTPAK
jgi:hypothetical protein